MTGVLRQLVGLIVIGALSAIVFIAITSASRFRLGAATVEAERVAKAEAALLGRLNASAPDQTSNAALPDDLIWPGGDPAAIEINIQQQILDAATEAGLQVMAFGAGPPADGIIQPTIGYEVELEGGHVEVARFLSVLEEGRPSLAIKTLWMRQLPPIDGVVKSPISLRMSAWGFRNADAVSP